MNGMPQFGHAAPSTLTLYRYYMPANTPSVTFALSPLAGGSFMYVSNSVDAQGRPYPMYRYCAVSQGGNCVTWAVTGYTWSSPGSFTLTAPYLLQTARWYTIGIFSTETTCCYGSDYIVTVNTAKALVQLENGIPVQGNVSTGQYLYYKLAVTAPFADVQVGGGSALDRLPAINMFILAGYVRVQPGRCGPVRVPVCAVPERDVVLIPLHELVADRSAANPCG